MKRTISGIILMMLLFGLVTLAFNIQPVKASGTVYIRADGSIDPPTATISSVDNVTYTLTDNIYDSIVVERDNIVVDGAGYTLQGTKTDYSRGIDLSGRSNVTIKNMEIKAFGYGIYLTGSSKYNSIVGNRITENNMRGIQFASPYFSDYNSIVGNNITNNAIGIDLGGTCNNSVVGNNIVANNYYSYYGIIVGGPSNSIVKNNITNNYYGIWIKSRGNNSVVGNKITFSWLGIWFWDSSNNIISENNITNNHCAIEMDYRSHSNVIYHNNFVNNVIQVSPSPVNVWDDGYPSGGNYWSDYTGMDEYHGLNQDILGSDGIGDTSYIIDTSNQDNYPLIHPYGSPKQALWSLIRQIGAMNLQRGIKDSLTAMLKNTIKSLDNGRENVAMQQLKIFMIQVEALRGKKLTNEQTDYLTSEAQKIINIIKG